MTIPVFRGIGGPEIGRAYIYEKNGELVASLHMDHDILPPDLTDLSIYVTPKEEA